MNFWHYLLKVQALVEYPVKLYSPARDSAPILLTGAFTAHPGYSAAVFQPPDRA
jgi:hypothetical protein